MNVQKKQQNNVNESRKREEQSAATEHWLLLYTLLNSIDRKNKETSAIELNK